VGWFNRLRRMLLGGTPIYDGTGFGRRTLAWQVANPGAIAALLTSQTELRGKSRDLVRRNAWANAALESYVANAVGTGIKPQSMVKDPVLREAIQALWSDWTESADAAGLTDFYGLQALACRAMLEGGEALVRIRYRRPEDGLPVALQLQVLEPEHLPVTLSTQADNGNVIRADIEFEVRATQAGIFKRRGQRRKPIIEHAVCLSTAEQEARAVAAEARDEAYYADGYLESPVLFTAQIALDWPE